ncbi:MAG: hypothetical protein KBG75_09240 [Pseudomonadales bacterium]|jgi:poly(3-hydroxybutyrate) depolymerase|nr:hypothetical protein [Pseudomonadales bacterium]
MKHQVYCVRRGRRAYPGAISKNQTGKRNEVVGDEVRPCIEAAGNYDFEILHDGRLRKFRVHLPASYRRDRAAPLLPSFHGGGAT